MIKYVNKLLENFSRVIKVIHMRLLVHVLIFILTTHLNATPSWESPTLHNGQLRIDGQLFKRFGLGMLNGSPEFKFPIYLEHNISKYPFGEFERFSQWERTATDKLCCPH